MAGRHNAALGPATPEQSDSSNLVLMEKHPQNVIGLKRRRMELLILVISRAPLGQSAAFPSRRGKARHRARARALQGCPRGNVCLHKCLCLHRCVCLHKCESLHKRAYTSIIFCTSMNICTRARICTSTRHCTNVLAQAAVCTSVTICTRARLCPSVSLHKHVSLHRHFSLHRCVCTSVHFWCVLYPNLCSLQVSPLSKRPGSPRAAAWAYSLLPCN